MFNNGSTAEQAENEHFFDLSSPHWPAVTAHRDEKDRERARWQIAYRLYRSMQQLNGHASVRFAFLLSWITSSLDGGQLHKSSFSVLTSADVSKSVVCRRGASFLTLKCHVYWLFTKLFPFVRGNSAINISALCMLLRCLLLSHYVHASR